MTEANYDKLQKSLARLREQYENYLSLDQATRKTLLGEAIVESTELRFNLCYEMLWKSLRKFLTDQFPDVPASPKGIYKQAFRGGFIDSDMAHALNRYHNARINSAHDYDERKGEPPLDVTADFIQDATKLHQIITTP